MGVYATVYALKSNSRFSVHKEHNLYSWKMPDTNNYIERLKDIDVGLSRKEMLALIEYSHKWGFGPNDEVKHRDLQILTFLEKWVSSKTNKEIFFECPDNGIEEYLLENNLNLDEFTNETIW